MRRAVIRAVVLAGLSGLCCLAVAGPVTAAEGEPDARTEFWRNEPSLVHAMWALRDGLPGVAAGRFSRALETPQETSQWTSDQRQWIARMEFKALSLAGQAQSALEQVERRPAAFESWPEWAFWHGHALAETGRFAEAVDQLGSVARDSPRWAEARLARASMLRSLDRQSEAVEMLTQVISDADGPLAGEAALMLAEVHLSHANPESAAAALPENQSQPTRMKPLFGYLRGRIALALGELDQADRSFEQIQQQAGDSWLAEVALVGAAKVRLDQQRPLEAADLLIRNLEQKTDSRFAAAKVEMAVRSGALRDEELRQRMERLAEGNHQAGWHARWHLAETLSTETAGLDAAEALLEGLVSSDAPERLRRAAMERRIHLHLRASRVGKAEALLDELLASSTLLSPNRSNYHRAAIELERGNNLRSWTLFRSLLQPSAGSASGRGTVFRSAATAALALAATVSGTDDEADTMLEQAARERPENDNGRVTPTGLLEAGLELARQRKPNSQALLERFVQDHSDHPRIVEAWIALAEVHLLAFPPQVGAAESCLASGRLAEPTAQQREHLDYLAAWAAASSDDRQRVAEQAARYLEEHPDSARRAEVRMKLAESYYRDEDFANAAAQFKLAAEDNAAPDVAMAALLFAGRASASLISQDGLEEAIELWQEVADSDSPLSFAARFQQAAALRRLSRWKDALEILDFLLAQEDSLVPPRKAAVLCARGQVLMAPEAATEIDVSRDTALADARTSFEQVLAMPSSADAWRHEARYRLARIAREQGDEDRALDLCHQIMRPIDPVDAGGPVEYEWFVRAGYEAIEILQSRQDWRGALAVAERIATVPGSRSNEARDLANRLRLEHFIWEN